MREPKFSHLSLVKYWEGGTEKERIGEDRRRSIKNKVVGIQLHLVSMRPETGTRTKEQEGCPGGESARESMGLQCSSSTNC